MNHYGFHDSSSLHHSNHHHQNQQPLTPISNLTTHHYHQDSPSQSHTLPPLHPQRNPISHLSYQYKNGASVPPTPRLPHTPDTPSTMGQNTLPHLAPHPAMNASETHTSYAPINHNSYSTTPTANPYASMSQQPSGMAAPNAGHYSYGTSMDYRQSNIVAYPYQQAPQEPSPIQSHQQQESQQIQSDASSHPQDQRPMPVVGSQGRRGILPSAAGQAPPPGSAPDGTMRGGATPNKNSENKYPCLYCQKTYLHLKHLKRHHLRRKVPKYPNVKHQLTNADTGERPYQCCLCNETFCRSDILKRHFIKCSIRRGNPTGATHLTHAQDHLKHTQPAATPTSATASASASASVPSSRTGPSSTVSSNPPSSYSGHWQSNPRAFGNFHGGSDLVSPQNFGDSNRSSRSSSVARPGSSSDDDVKKRYSSSSTLATVAGTVEASPQVLQGHDRNISFNYNNHDRQLMNSQREYSNGNIYHPVSEARMPMSTHAEGIAPAGYYREGYQHFPAIPQQNQMPQQQQQQQQQWNHCFQPGASDHMMYTGHQ